MHIPDYDVVFTDYVGEKNRKRIHEDLKQPMISLPVALYRAAKNVDDVRRDTINKMCATLILGQGTYLVVSTTSDIAVSVASIIATAIPIWALQASKAYNNAFWKDFYRRNTGNIFRNIMWWIFLYKGILDMIALATIYLWPVNSILFFQSICWHYLGFHLIYTIDTLPKRKEEEAVHTKNYALP